MLKADQYIKSKRRLFKKTVKIEKWELKKIKLTVTLCLEYESMHNVLAFIVHTNFFVHKGVIWPPSVWEWSQICKAGCLG